MNIFKLSWKNILAKPLNSIMSVLLFALSIGLITFLTLFNHQFKRGLENNFAGIALVIGAKGSPLQLILNSMYHIDAPTGNIAIGEAAPFLNPKHPLLSGSIPLSLGDSYGAFRIVGTTPSIFKFYGATQVEGDIYKNDFDVVTGSDVADKLHLHIGDEFYSTHGLEDNPDLAHDHGHPFVVKGILQPTGTVLDQLILTTPQTVWKVHEHDSTATDQEGSGHEGHHHDDAAHNHTSMPIQLKHKYSLIPSSLHCALNLIEKSPVYWSSSKPGQISNPSISCAISMPTQASWPHPQPWRSTDSIR